MQNIPVFNFITTIKYGICLFGLIPMTTENNPIMENSTHQTGKYIIFIIVAGLIVWLDQFTKALVLKQLALYQSIIIIPGFLNLTHVHNPGGAFGFLASNGSILRPVVFLGAAIFALGLILYFHHKTPGTYRFLSTALAMVFGGAIGNLIDRFRMGVVVDFLDVYIGKYHWPAFNVADAAITVGVGIFIFYIATNKLPN
jgi:signal peptidase II